MSSPDQAPRLIESSFPLPTIPAALSREALEAEQQHLALDQAAFVVSDSCSAFMAARDGLAAGERVAYLWSYRRSLGRRGIHRDWAVAFQRPHPLPPLGYVELSASGRAIYAPDAAGGYAVVDDLAAVT